MLQDGDEVSNLTIANEIIVLGLIKKATEFTGTEIQGVMGKKALQKSLYLFNLEHNRFHFRWGDYGPISGEVQQIAYDLISRGNVIVHNIETGRPEAIIKNMQFSQENNPDFPENLPEDIDSSLNRIVRFAAGRNPRDLELLASVHYWAARQQSLLDEYTVDYVFEKLNDLKPDANFNRSDVETAVGTLEENGFLQTGDNQNDES